MEHDTPESDEDWMEHLKKRYEHGTDEGKGNHRPAGTTRAVGDGHEARKVLMSGQRPA